MSRPPRPYSGKSTTAPSLLGRGGMDYLPSELADFVERERALAAAELGLVSSGREGDFTVTLMELSAMVAHILGVYQDRHAREAFLSTAQSARSLARHSRRLGYEPDPGLAATGYLLLSVREGLAGTIPKGFAVASAPLGEKRSEDYETLEDTAVHHARNELRVRDHLEAFTLAEPERRFDVAGVRLGLAPGNVVVLEASDGALTAHMVVTVSEAADRTATTIGVDKPHLLPSTVTEGFRLHGRPATRTHLFGWDTSPLTFSEAELKAGKFRLDGDGDRFGYEIEGHDEDDDDKGVSKHDLYLARELDAPVLGTPIVRLDATGASAFRVLAEGLKTVSFRKETSLTAQVAAEAEEGGVDLTTTEVPVRTGFSATVTALRVGKDKDHLEDCTQQAIRTSLWLLHFELVVPLVHQRPSSMPVTAQSSPLRLEGLVEGLRPGQLLALSRIDDPHEDVVDIAEITSVDKEDGDSTVSWRVIDSSGDYEPWTLGNVRIRGNVARVSHGKTVEEVLGHSDGITPFLRFALKEKPLTHLPGPGGGEPALELRVGGVLWTRVEDFHDSDADDRHYLLQRDEAAATSVVFGDGQRGAIPPAGKRHVTARYRVGLGRAGNAEARRVSRIKKAHPLLSRAYNPLRVGGGADPAGAREIRAQAACFIKTFDRAVSAQDHADLALLFPGVARAAAYLTMSQPAKEGGAPSDQARTEVIRVVVADAAGKRPEATSAIQKFLEARRDSRVPLELKGPSIQDVKLKVHVEVDPAYLPEAVLGAVREALYGEREDAPGLFTFAQRGLGKSAFLSEVYDAITALPGVAFVEITEFDLVESDEDWRVLDVIPAAPGAWLRLLPEGFAFSRRAEDV